MTKTIEVKIRKITPWIFTDSNEKFSHLEIYFTTEGRHSYRGIMGTRQQIIEHLGLDSSRSLESNLPALIGKKVRITKDAQTNFISHMQMMPVTRNAVYKWSVGNLDKQVAKILLIKH